MARRRKRKNADSSATRSRKLPRLSFNLSWIRPPSGHVLRQSFIGIAWLAAISGLAAAWILGVPKLQAFAVQQHTINPHDVTVRFNDPPAMSPELWDTLTRTAAMQVNGNPLVRDDLVSMRRALLDTGWFDSIDQIRRVKDDVIEIDAHFVRPYTLVRDNDGDHLIDCTGKLLPMSFQRNAKLKFKPIAITGAYFQRPRRVGLPWEGADVAAGLELIQLLQQQPWNKQITEIDVSAYLKGGSIKLRTDKDCTIVWGGAPGEEPALEVLSAGKLQRLDFLYKRYGRIDRNQGGELDITGEKAVVSR